jgi:uncharacterized protein YdeI (YjbR/CyaY-like superfamily)
MVVVEGTPRGSGRVKPTFFRSAAAFRRWLATHHATERELLVGFYHRGSGQGGITYPEARDEALCFGWIDGVRRNHGPSSYVIRFTPRKPGSNWSAVNLARVRALSAEGRMHAAGLKAFRARPMKRDYSYEARPEQLAAPYLKRLRASPSAWAFFKSQPPWVQRTATHWILSAKREETRLSRLAALIAAAERGERPAPFLVSRRERSGG